jgi:Reverse transcriptase (RNA-dependent DNA polymerase)
MRCCAGEGSAASPVIANLFLHYAFDMWMTRTFPGIAFERYVDDAVIHCASEQQAREVLAALQERMSEVGLALHPDKTRIVYCQDTRRCGSHEHTSFTFLRRWVRRGKPKWPAGAWRRPPARRTGGWPAATWCF